MENGTTYTLDELAEEFGLTPRTARHYIENVLPPHHKTGRGKLARYGQDTWNCFAFIQKARAEEKLTSAQISRVFADLNQEEINRVAEGLEDLRIVPTPSASSMMRDVSPRMASASMRRSRYRPKQELPPAEFMLRREIPDSLNTELEPGLDDVNFSLEESGSPLLFQNIYSDNELRIQYRGEANHEQREQVNLAARLIKRILKSSD